MVPEAKLEETVTERLAVLGVAHVDAHGDEDLLDRGDRGRSLVEVESEHGTISGTTAAIPFVDPSKERPARPLERSSG